MNKPVYCFGELFSYTSMKLVDRSLIFTEVVMLKGYSHLQMDQKFDVVYLDTGNATIKFSCKEYTIEYNLNFG